VFSKQKNTTLTVQNRLEKLRMKKLENRVSVITGAGSGIGYAIAAGFASEGSLVVATDINNSRLQHLENEIHRHGGTVRTVVADMASEEDIKHMIELAVETYGTVDILVNNAGIMDDFSPVGDVPNDMWQKVMKVNLDGPFMAMRMVVPIFLAKGNGVIINIASVGGLTAGKAGAAYTTSKYALIGLTKNTGYLYSKSGIRCNAIAPGAVSTNITETIDFNKVTPLVNDRVMKGMELNPRTGEPVEIAKAAIFLASDDASFVNGSVLTVDGGWTAY